MIVWQTLYNFRVIMKKSVRILLKSDSEFLTFVILKVSEKMYNIMVIN